MQRTLYELDLGIQISVYVSCVTKTIPRSLYVAVTFRCAKKKNILEKDETYLETQMVFLLSINSQG